MTPKQDSLEQVLNAIYGPGPSEEASQYVQQKLKLDFETISPIVFYDLIPNSPIGAIWVAASVNGLIGIDFDMSEGEFLQQANPKNEFRMVREGGKISDSLEEVLDYVNGEIELIDLPIDLSRLTEFQRKVLLAARAVPRGQVATYSEIAKRVGSPKAFRAVGQALRRNPIPIVIPCHRVISSDGTLGGYGGVLGSERKINLLKLEGVVLT